MSRLPPANKLLSLAAIVIALFVAFGPLSRSNPVLVHSAAVVFITLVLWSTGALPSFLTSLIFFALVLVLNLAKPDVVFAGFGSAAVWLIISGFVIGKAISKTGLGDRLAALLAPMVSGSYPRMISGLAAAASLLGFVMPSSAGRAVVMLPIGMALADRVGFEAGSNGRKGIAVTLALACNLPSFAILPANIPNMILAGASEHLHGVMFSYGEYLALHFPVLGVLKTLLMIALVLALFPDKVRPVARDVAVDREAIEGPHAVGGQARVGWILLVTLALWMTDSLHGINAAWVGLVAAILLMLPRTGVVPATDFNGAIDFGIVVFVAAALGLGALVNDSGLGKQVGELLLGALPLQPGSPMLNFYSLCSMSALTGVVTTIPGVPTVLTPMAHELSSASGFSLTAVLMTQVVGFSTVLFPYQVGPLVLAMQLSGEKLTDLVKTTLPLALLTFMAILPIDYLWWRFQGLI